MFFTADGLNIKNMSPMWGIAIGTIVGIFVLSFLICLNIWRSRNLFANRATNNNVERKHERITAAPITIHCEDINPDIIPAKYGKFSILTNAYFKFKMRIKKFLN